MEIHPPLVHGVFVLIGPVDGSLGVGPGSEIVEAVSEILAVVPERKPMLELCHVEL